MMSVGLSESDVQPYLSKVPANSVAVACINAPHSITLSGDESSIDQLGKFINDDGLFAKKLRIHTAGHSYHMEVIADDYLKSMGTLIPLEGHDDSITMFSSVTAAPISAKDIDALYWVKNMISPVRFSEAVNALVAQNPTENTNGKAAVSYAAAIEIGPAETLRGPLTQTLAAIDDRLTNSILYTSMLSRRLNADVSALTAAGKLWAQGLDIDLHAVNFQGNSSRKYQCLATLPPYPWNHNKAYSHESDWGKTYRYLEKPRTDLLGMRLPNQDPTEPRWHNWIRLSEQPWIADHKVQQRVMYPGSAMIVMAIQAARELVDPKRFFKAIESRDILFKKPLFIPSADTAVETAIHLRPTLTAFPQRKSYDFCIFSQAERDGWQENCSGTVSILYENDKEEAALYQVAWKSDIELYDLIRKRATKKISPHTFYKLFDGKMNLQYGPLHQNVTECVAGNGEGHGTITIPDTKSIMPSNFEYPHLIHPSTLDSILHVQALGYLSTLSDEESIVPISISSIYIAASIPRQAGTELKGYSQSAQTQSGDSVGDIVLSTDEWTSPKVVVRGFCSRDVSAGNPDSDNRSTKCTSFEWINFFQEPQAPLPKLSELLLLCGSAHSPAIQSLTHSLADAGASISESVQIVSLHDVDSLDFRGKTIISLVEAETSAVAKWTESDFDQFKNIMLQADAVLWVTRGGGYTIESELEFSVTTGLLRTIRVERSQLKLPHIDLSPEDPLDTSSNVEAILAVGQSSIFNTDEASDQEFKVKGGKLMVPRLKKQEAFHAELSRRTAKATPLETRLADISGPVEGLFGSKTKDFAWQHIPEISEELGGRELEIELSSVHLDQADLTEGIIGRDAVGTIRKVGTAVTDLYVGNLVVVCGLHLMKTTIRVKQSVVQHLPESVDKILAATIPSALCAAYAVLVDLARLQPGDSVVICSTPGSLENALIHLATQLNADVFVLAQSSHHRNELIQSFGLDDGHVLQSTATEPFPSRLQVDGFDIIVATLSGAVMDQSISCLRDWGRFISIGRQSLGSTAIPLARNISISNFDLEHMKTASPDRFEQLFKRSWAGCLEHGMPPSTPFRNYPSSEIKSAIAYLEDETTTASTVIEFSPHDTLAINPAKRPILALDPKATYILSGGLGGIGRTIAEIMFNAGARNISFLSRSGSKSEEAKHLLSSLTERGCEAQAFQCDITDGSQVQSFVDSCIERGEYIKGVIQCAMVLRDSMFENMTFEQWTETTQPKVQGSWNLHQVMPADLDFFIMLSSMTGVIGNPGQANYAAGGTYQDALSQYRRRKGLASTTIDLGIVSDVGYVAENPEQFERLDGLEDLFISERDLRIILEATMLGKTRNGENVPAQLTTGVGKEMMSKGILGNAMCNDLKYVHLRESFDGSGILAEVSEEKPIQDRLKSASSVKEACAVVEGGLATLLSKALNMEKGDVDLEKPIHAFGGKSAPRYFELILIIYSGLTRGC
jgi:NADPH:quinone reductase-like Zn-dependent oxidoreductase/NADP-dependent 3-hydroxy acid dehydrogenase YdfG